MNLVLVVDIGTTNIKAAVIDKEGQFLSFSENELEIERDASGAVEHNPDKLYKNFLRLSQQVLQGFEDKVSALSICSYQFGLLPISKSGKPLMGMMTLLDTRAKEIIDKLKEKYDLRKLYQNTGCPPLFQYPLAKIFWLKERKKEIFKDTSYFLSSPKDYIIYRLLGKPFTEPSIASATQLFNIHTLSWDDYALAGVDIERNKLPSVVPSEQILCELSLRVCKKLGLKRKVFLVPGVYDGGGVALGLGGWSEKSGIINVGTSAMLRVFSSTALLDSTMRLQTYYLCNGKWLTGAGINNAGSVFKWFQENIGIGDYNSLIAQAGKVKACSEGVFFLPYLTGERDPYIGSSASGVIFGIRGYHTQSHLIRALLEGVAYSLGLIKDSLGKNGVRMKEVRVGGGGAKSILWCRIFADVLNLPVRRFKKMNASLMGGAILTYVAVGVYKGIKEATEKMVRLEKAISPNSENVKVYKEGFAFYKRLVKHIYQGI